MIVTVGHEQQASDESKACCFESDGETAALALALALISCWLLRVPFLWKQTLPLEGAASIGPPARLGQRWQRSLCRPFSRCGLRAAGSCRVQLQGALVDRSMATVPERCRIVSVCQCWWCGSRFRQS